MKNKVQESIHAYHIGYVISDILMIIGAIMFLIAWIVLSNEEYGYGEQASLLEMRRYGLTLVIGGFISMIACNIAIMSNDTAKRDATGEKICDLCNNSVDKLQQAVVGDEIIYVCSECAKKSLSNEQNQSSDS